MELKIMFQQTLFTDIYYSLLRPAIYWCFLFLKGFGFEGKELVYKPISVKYGLDDNKTEVNPSLNVFGYL